MVRRRLCGTLFQINVVLKISFYKKGMSSVFANDLLWIFVCLRSNTTLSSFHEFPNLAYAYRGNSTLRFINWNVYLVHNEIHPVITKLMVFSGTVSKFVATEIRPDQVLVFFVWHKSSLNQFCFFFFHFEGQWFQRSQSSHEPYLCITWYQRQTSADLWRESVGCFHLRLGTETTEDFEKDLHLPRNILRRLIFLRNWNSVWRRYYLEAQRPGRMERGRQRLDWKLYEKVWFSPTVLVRFQLLDTSIFFKDLSKAN